MSSERKCCDFSKINSTFFVGWQGPDPWGPGPAGPAGGRCFTCIQRPLGVRPGKICFHRSSEAQQLYSSAICLLSRFFCISTPLCASGASEVQRKGAAFVKVCNSRRHAPNKRRTELRPRNRARSISDDHFQL